ARTAVMVRDSIARVPEAVTLAKGRGKGGPAAGAFLPSPFGGRGVGGEGADRAKASPSRPSPLPRRGKGRRVRGSILARDHQVKLVRRDGLDVPLLPALAAPLRRDVFHH